MKAESDEKALLHKKPLRYRHELTF